MEEEEEEEVEEDVVEEEQENKKMGEKHMGPISYEKTITRLLNVGLGVSSSVHSL